MYHKGSRWLITVLFMMSVSFALWFQATLAQARAKGAFDQGLKAARTGQLDRAIKLWTKTLKKKPKCYAAYINRGTALMQSGHIMKGINDWHKAKKVEPVFAYGLCPADYIPEASSHRKLLGFAKSTELDPNYVPSVMMTGIAYSELGHKKLAANLFRMCVDLTKNPMMKSRFDHWKTALEENFDD